MSEVDDAAYSQYRVFAESHNLRCIGKFDAAAQKRLMAVCEGTPYSNADQALDDFSWTQSITEAQVEWIVKSWRDRNAANPNSDPKKFAAEVANDVFPEIEF